MFIKNPNLPNGKVISAICDGRISHQIYNELDNLGIKIIKTDKHPNLPEPVSYHPDMQFYYDGNGIFYLNDDNKSLLNNFEGANVIFVNKLLTSKYPNDILFNICKIGDTVICMDENEITEKISYKDLIKVKQGYTKCSILPISDNAFITDDISIYKSLYNKMDVLLIDKGEIMLNGYSYGFIGGCGGKIDIDKICFFGKIEEHKNFNSIKSFLQNHRILHHSLSNEKLYDYGSFIPIEE